MEFQDDRSTGQMASHPWIVIMTDNFMSRLWGHMGNAGPSYAGWACRDKDRAKVWQWVDGRSDSLRVREVYGKYRPSGPGHCHIYVVNDGHPSLA